MTTTSYAFSPNFECGMFSSPSKMTNTNSTQEILHPPPPKKPESKVQRRVLKGDSKHGSILSSDSLHFTPRGKKAKCGSPTGGTPVIVVIQPHVYNFGKATAAK
jgi:hypothetical protein